jgi:hypothetical protein
MNGTANPTDASSWGGEKSITENKRRRKRPGKK